MKIISILLITLCATSFGRVGSDLENLYIVGLGWVNNTVGWVGLGPADLDPCTSLN